MELRRFCLFITFTSLITAVGGPANAETIDLTKVGSSGTAGGALFTTTETQPTGTGVLDPFVRIQMTGTERGYNTDARPIEFDTKDQNQWTHSLNLNAMALEKLNGKSYYKFLLDINEEGNRTGKLLSLNDLHVHLGNSPSLTGYNDGFGENSVSVFNLDAGTDITIELNSKLNHGSGSGDMFAYIPVSNFAGFDSDYQWVYLYSAFGTPNESDSGFEEWAASVDIKKPDIVHAPTPSTTLLAVIGLGCVAARMFRRRLQSAC